MTLFEELDEQKNGPNPDIPDGWVRVVEAVYDRLDAAGSKVHPGVAPEVASDLGFDLVIVDGIYYCSPKTAETVANVIHEK